MRLPDFTPDVPGVPKSVRDAFLNVVSLGERENPGSLRRYGSDVRASLDPRTPEGIASIAALFVPGPGGKGGRVSEMTAFDRAYMNQLNNVKGGPGTGSPLSYREESMVVLPWGQSKDKPPLTGIPQDLAGNALQLGDLLGYTRGSPLWFSQHRPRPFHAFTTKSHPLSKEKAQYPAWWGQSREWPGRPYGPQRRVDLEGTGNPITPSFRKKWMEFRDGTELRYRNDGKWVDRKGEPASPQPSKKQVNEAIVRSSFGTTAKPLDAPQLPPVSKELTATVAMIVDALLGQSGSRGRFGRN